MPRPTAALAAVAALSLALTGCSMLNGKESASSEVAVKPPVVDETPDPGNGPPVTQQKKTKSVEICTLFNASDVNQATNDEMEGTLAGGGSYCVVSTKKSQLAVDVMEIRYEQGLQDQGGDGTKLRIGGNRASQKLGKAKDGRAECYIVVQLNSINEFGPNAVRIEIVDYTKGAKGPKSDLCGVARSVTEMVFNKIPAATGRPGTGGVSAEFV
ncbi:hypothetical protein GCM10020229_77030 [Kitasatospora albolonga]|uniref:hypothetical protein n=1 Tax=Kitasatospora albolonga TaxID=68173 RepID=UPI0031EFCAED